jgi:hypothetical protein
MNMQSARVKAGLTLVLLWSAMPASAQQTLDQAYTAQPTTGIIVSNDQTLAQTFTVGRSERLYALYVQAARDLIQVPTHDLILELRTTLADGRPSDNILATSSVPPESIPVSTERSFVGFDFTFANIDLHAGDSLALVLRTDEPVTGGNINPFAWYADDPGNYARGKAYISHASAGGDFSPTLLSFGFRTYTTSVVPAPGALMTALIGVIPATTLLLRRRRRC